VRQQNGGFVCVEAQIGGADLDHLAFGSQACQW
jgi:hypothetical protein